MNQSDIAVLMKGAAPAIHDLVIRTMQPFADRIAELERDLAAALAVDTSHLATKEELATVAREFQLSDRMHDDALAAIDGVRAEVAEVRNLVEALPVPKDGRDGVDGQPGRDVDPEVVRSMIVDAVAAVPVPKDGADGAPGRDGTDGAPGKDADPQVMRQMVAEAVSALPVSQDGAPGRDAEPETIRSMVAEAVAELPAAEPGKDADPEVTAELVRAEVERAVAALPLPQDGRSVTPEELVPLIEERLPALISEAVARIPVPKDGEPGKDGAPGKLPIVKEWTDGVHYQGDVRSHGGSTYQALRDTAKEPPHDDWICLAGRGDDGKDARQIVIRGTYAESGEYAELDVVALNGATFIAKKDDPGPCPGEGWQLMSAQGKTGKPGDRGAPGARGERGDPGLPLVAGGVDDQGLLTLVNGDGSRVECDLYPVLSKIGAA